MNVFLLYSLYVFLAIILPGNWDNFDKIANTEFFDFAFFGVTLWFIWNQVTPLTVPKGSDSKSAAADSELAFVPFIVALVALGLKASAIFILKYPTTIQVLDLLIVITA